MKFDHINDHASIYCGDAIEVMQKLIDCRTKVHCIITDPPYLLTSGGNTQPKYDGHVRMKGCFDGTKYDNCGKLVACDIDWLDFFPLLYQIMDRGHAYVMTNAKNMQYCLNAASISKIQKKHSQNIILDLYNSLIGKKQKQGFELHNILTWDKRTATPNRWYMKNLEFTCMFYKGKAKPINDCSSMAGVTIPHRDETEHPTEKPVQLMEYYIRNSTQEGDIVFDPFMGTGTTGVAAIKNNRGFIGIEQEDKWYNVAKTRINRAFDERQGFLF